MHNNDTPARDSFFSNKGGLRRFNLLSSKSKEVVIEECNKGDIDLSINRTDASNET
jgi:hypothetical protein